MSFEITKISPSQIEDNVLVNRVDFINDNLLYKGQAKIGSDNSASVWRICKIVIGTDGDVTETYASAHFDKVWNDRLTLIYN